MLMGRYNRGFCLTLIVVASGWSQTAEQHDSGWRISPERINIQAGADRRLQLLDDSARELHGAEWSVDDPKLADIDEDNGRLVVHAKAAGTLRVTATLGLEKRTEDIKIWPADRPIPEGTTGWGMHPIGRDLGDIAAVPTAEGPNSFSLEQTASGSTYLRGMAEDGIQVWNWLLPEKTHDVELVCGDWLGGALISANHGNSYTLYTVTSTGALRWQRTLNGVRKGHAYNLDHLVHVLSQSPDGKITKLTGIDGQTGTVKFDLAIPLSHETQVNVRTVAGKKIICQSQSFSSATRTLASRLFVNIDGFAYVAFTQNEWTLEAPNCKPGEAVEPGGVNFTRDERVVLWQVHPDGTYRGTTIEHQSSKQHFTDTMRAYSPTGAIIPDGLGGVLLPIKWSNDDLVRNVHGPDELIYRINEDGEVVYKLLLPRYDGPLRDEMVLGQDNRGFATRGSLLIAFSVETGSELWRWDSGVPDIGVFAALANGGCLVQTATALVEVDSASEAKEIFKGKAMMDWQGQLFRKSD